MNTLSIVPFYGDAPANHGEYVLAQGRAAVRRLFVLHKIYAAAGRRLLLQAGLERGMHVADFGCGVGAMTRMLGEWVGQSGSVTGIDLSADQLAEAAEICASAGLSNVSFRNADACATRLPANSFDLVYCRFLLLHLTAPHACLREMKRILKPGGILVVEDGDIASAGSVPPTAIATGVALFMRLGASRGLNYSLANSLFHLVKSAGFVEPQIEIHQPAGCCGLHGDFVASSVAEAAPAFVNAGLIAARDLDQLIVEMRTAGADPSVLVLAPRMSGVWARKAA
jgi:ubiquinone/menaquinone biosynthesis C-methylase UbiE